MKDSFMDAYISFREYLCWKTKTDGGRYYQDIIHTPSKKRALETGEKIVTRRYLRIKGGVAKNHELLAKALELFGEDAVRVASFGEGLWNGDPEPIIHITLPNSLFVEET